MPSPFSLKSLFDSFRSEWDELLLQPGVPSISILYLTILGLMVFSLIASLFVGGQVGSSNNFTIGQFLFSLYARLGRVKNLILSPILRMRGIYPVSNTCQIPMFHSISDVYNFIFGYVTGETHMFVEIGAYDGESFSNTSCLSDLGWTGHYIEPIKEFAHICANRHSGNPNVYVHNICVGESDNGEAILSNAGPFTSGVEDEINAVSNSRLQDTLKFFGWNHQKDDVSNESFQRADKKKRAQSSVLEDSIYEPQTLADYSIAEQLSSNRIRMKTVSLNTFMKLANIPGGGAIDVMVIDVEGMEWSILKEFDILLYRPKVMIIELMNLQRKFAESHKYLQECDNIMAFCFEAGYQILYRDQVNTVFVHKSHTCVGG